MNRFFKPTVLLLIIAGILVGGLLFVFGYVDDAPGLCAIGLSVGFILIMLGVNKMGVIKKGLLVPILLLCFGVFITVLTTAILLGGEFGETPWYSTIAYAAGFVLLLIGMIKFRAFRNAVFKKI